MMLFSWFWQKAALERAIKSAAQYGLLAFGPTVMGWMGLNWTYVGYAVAGGFVISYLTSIVSTPFGPDNNPSLV